MSARDKLGMRLVDFLRLLENPDEGWMDLTAMSDEDSISSWDYEFYYSNDPYEEPNAGMTRTFTSVFVYLEHGGDALAQGSYHIPEEFIDDCINEGYYQQLDSPDAAGLFEDKAVDDLCEFYDDPVIALLAYYNGVVEYVDAIGYAPDETVYEFVNRSTMFEPIC